jgi:hypothetical protein
MPFPSAHPAAVLPFRRYCPRLFIFPALVIGSLIPDFSYVFQSAKIAGFAHHAVGSFCFDLPMGLVARYAFFAFRFHLVALLPGNYRKIFLPLCRHRRGSWANITMSLLVGIWTHLILDAATHKNGWLFWHLPFLKMPLFMIGKHLLRTSDVLWFVCTFFGTAWIAVAYLEWLERVTQSPKLGLARSRIGYALAFALLVFPFAVMHKFLNSYLGIYPVSACTLVLAIIFALKMVKVASPVAPSKPDFLRHAS